MGSHGSPWGPMGPHGFPWVPMGFPWGLMVPHGFPWVPMGSHESPWVPMGPHGFPWVPMDTHGSPWGPMFLRICCHDCPVRKMSCASRKQRNERRRVTRIFKFTRNLLVDFWRFLWPTTMNFDPYHSYNFLAYFSDPPNHTQNTTPDK